MSHLDPAAPVDAATQGPLLRINEVAAELGLTTRAIRYYEEMGLLEPAARSDGDYRLYDPSDVERLRFIKSLRDDAGFSLAQIGQLLEDEAARERNRERLRQTTDPAERRRYFAETRDRVDRQIALLEAKADRLALMIDEARSRRAHLDEHLAELDDQSQGRAGTPAKRGRRR
jgi:DNA-binding transcriptional MerR regulator